MLECLGLGAERQGSVGGIERLRCHTEKYAAQEVQKVSANLLTCDRDPFGDLAIKEVFLQRYSTPLLTNFNRNCECWKRGYLLEGL